MKVLFYFGHPAHYHNVSVVMPALAARGHEVLMVARKKDVLPDLLEGLPYPLFVVQTKAGDLSKLDRASAIVGRERKMLSICKKHRPDLLFGTDMVITHIGRLLKIPSMVMNEDDAAAVPLFAKYAYRFATAIVAPECCDVGRYGNKKIAYKGYHELAYLRPEHFTPDRKLIPELGEEKYFILRFSKLSAHHDKGMTGITDDLAEKLIELLKPHGNVFITSERELPGKFEPYRIQIHPKLIHHALAFAELYIGDSQTMAAEAAVLGTPSIRFNDFVGKLSYLEELEHTYKLTMGISATQPGRLLVKTAELLGQANLHELWQGRRQKMLANTIDVAAFITGIIEEN